MSGGETVGNREINRRIVEPLDALLYLLGGYPPADEVDVPRHHALA
jgi:hypothetical protein